MQHICGGNDKIDTREIRHDDVTEQSWLRAGYGGDFLHWQQQASGIIISKLTNYNS
jgi:hypothetical protein